MKICKLRFIPFSNTVSISQVKLEGECVWLEEAKITGLKPNNEVIKLFSCSTQLSMKFFPLINVKMPTVNGILTFMSRKIAF